MLRSSRHIADIKVQSSGGRPNTAFKRIRGLMDASKWKQAWSEMAPILKAEPKNPTVQWVAGLLKNELGDQQQALTYLRYAAEHIKDEPTLFQALAGLESAVGDPKRGRDALEYALSLEVSVPGLLGLAKAYQVSGQRALEIQALEEAFELDPNDATIAYRLASVHQACFDPTPALEWAMKAVKLKEDYWEAYMVLATVLQRLEKLNEAIEIYHSLLLVWPNDGKINRNLGVLCLRLGLNREAIRYFTRAAEGEPNRVDLECDIVHQLLYVCDWEELDSRVQPLLDRMRSSTEAVAPFGLLSIPRTTPNDLKVAAERTAANIVSGLKFDAKAFERHVEPGEAERRLKIGYLSCDLHDHATGYLMARLFELHDRSQFELYAYTWDNYLNAPLRKRLTEAFETVRDVRVLADQQAAELIRSDEIDILIDLKGYTRDGRLAIAAHRPAPVTVHHVGFPGTLGAPFIDYLVADSFVAPLDHPEYFTEKIAHMPNCYQPTDDTRPISPRPSRAECGLPENGIVFCSFNQAYKFIPEVFDAWCQLLLEVPGSVLWLLQWTKASSENLTAWAKKRGVEPERLVWAPSRKQADHLARLQNADIVLDTLPVNAHTTASDALWAGVPIVTRPGEAFVSRVAGSIVLTMGLPDLIARDEQDYFRISKELATQPELLARTKERVMVGRTESPLFNTARYTKDLEALYREMWRRRANGLPAQTLKLESSR
ncbi:MAG TPA: tetratricopeptide repeat protein [Polyangiaceae bacterium]|nr:tetratricopeptide repeat protein [Polyangiaceae bacterium]